MIACADCREPFHPHHMAVVRCPPCRDSYKRAKRYAHEKARLIRKHGKAYRVDAYERRRRPIREAWAVERAKRAEELCGLLKRAQALRPDKPWRAEGLKPGERHRIRSHLDPQFALARYLTDAVRRRVPGRKIRDHVREALTKGGERATLCAFLGYSIADLRQHIEDLFSDGMTWAAYAEGRIHIDHKRPLRCYRLSDPRELRAAWALTNLQPLWALDNLQKGGRA